MTTRSAGSLICLLATIALAACGADEGPGFDANGDADAPDMVPDADAPPDAADDPVEDPVDDAADDPVDDPVDDPGEDAEEDAPVDAGTDCLSRSTGEVGEACAIASDCSAVPAADPGDIQCFTLLSIPGTTVSLPFPCGYCTASCTDDSDCGGFPDGVCARDVFGGDIIRMCLKSCDTDSDCRDDEGYTCNDLGGYVVPALTYCAPPLRP